MAGFWARLLGRDGKAVAATGVSPLMTSPPAPAYLPSTTTLNPAPALPPLPIAEPTPPTLDASTGLPVVMREPLIPIGSDFRTVQEVKDVVAQLDWGRFRQAARLVEQTMWNIRLRAVFDTRLDGMVSTTIRWEPGRANAQGRRAVAAIEEDWPLIISAATRKQNHQWGLGLGVSFAQKHWYESPYSGRAIPRAEVYHPQFAFWHWWEQLYWLITYDGQIIKVPSPAISRDISPTIGSWIVHEPFGKHSWRQGYVHSYWQSWLGNTLALRDLARADEKLGLGIIKAIFPHLTDDKGTAAKEKFVRGFRLLGREGTIPCEDFGSDGKFDAQFLESNGQGLETILRSLDVHATAFSILMLGHNLSAEAKGAGSYALMGGASEIRGDKKTFDARSEDDTYSLQLIGDWALANFGDRELAPRMVADSDPPSVNLAAAQTLELLGRALPMLHAAFPGIDVDAILRRFRAELLPGGARPVAVTAKAPANDVGGHEPEPAPDPPPPSEDDEADNET